MGRSTVSTLLRCAVAALGRCAVAALGRSAIAALGRCAVAALGRCAVAALRRSAVAALGRCAITALRRSAITALRRSAITALRRSAIATLGRSAIAALRGCAVTVALGSAVILLLRRNRSRGTEKHAGQLQAAALVAGILIVPVTRRQCAGQRNLDEAVRVLAGFLVNSLRIVGPERNLDDHVALIIGFGSRPKKLAQRLADSVQVYGKIQRFLIVRRRMQILCGCECGKAYVQLGLPVLTLDITRGADVAQKRALRIICHVLFLQI